MDAGCFQCNFVSTKHANDLRHYYRKITRNYPRGGLAYEVQGNLSISLIEKEFVGLEWLN